MHKYSFLDDYSEGCHPSILAALNETNQRQLTAYGFDRYSNQAKRLIAQRLDNPDAQIYFVAGGTQANLIVAAAALRAHEAVISATTGHVAGREAGALEATGHKIIALGAADGKLTPGAIQGTLEQHTAIPHVVRPRLVYISNASEIGTLYSRAELTSLHACCQQNGLLLFLDGARLGAALCARHNDLTLADLSRLTDAFTIGGTKNGALLGEAIVINNAAIGQDFNIQIKQRGALLAKGRILGLQFMELFKDDLYFELATHANAMAEKIANALPRKGYRLRDQAQSNQVFAILPDSLIARLQRDYSFYVWDRHDEDHAVVRLVTSWATQEARVDEFISCL